MKKNNTNMVTFFIKALKKFEKHNPQIFLIPEKELLNPEKAKGGEIISLNNSYVPTGFQMKGTKTRPILYIGMKKILEQLLEEAKKGKKGDELMLSPDEILIKAEDVEKIEKQLKDEK